MDCSSHLAQMGSKEVKQSQTFFFYLRKPRAPKRYWIRTTTTSWYAAMADPSYIEADPMASPPPWIQTMTWQDVRTF